ncbi:MAG: phosphonate ABC transporter, permease protein PhnE [Rhodovarius sp.]|nr:phosphonate ABC transporter, permease protein PhnE [Rhodovarius sp.]
MTAGAAVAAAEQNFRLLRAERARRSALALLLLGILFVLSAWVSELSPAKLAAGLPRIGEYAERTLPVLRLSHLGEDLAEWFWDLGHWLQLLAETVVMAYVATLLATLGALAGCFLAARGLTPSPLAALIIRRGFEFARAVPELVFALLFIYAFGLGAMAGVLAVALHSLGAQGKLFAEAAEAARRAPMEGVLAAGGNWLQAMRFGILPQVLPVFASFTLWRFEINVRNSAIIGFVGAGGIGEALYTAVRLLHYEDVSALLILLVLTVALIDQLCARLRHALIGRESAR